MSTGIEEPKQNAAEVLAALPCGKIIGEGIDFYHAAPAVSVSKLKVFRQSPALYHGRFIAKSIAAPEATPALLIGSAAGCYMLEGAFVFDAQYYVIPKGVGKQRKADKELREILAAENPGKKALDFDDMAMILRMNDSLQNHRFAGPMVRACKPEITWRLKGEMFHMQVRTDGWSDEGCELTDGMPFIGDLKTIPEMPDDEPETISRQIANFWYHGQEWTYRNVVSTICKFPNGFMPRFFFWFVEKEEPYGVQVVELDEIAQDLAFRQVKDTLDRLKECHLRNYWPHSWLDSWQKKIPSVALPNYYVRREIGDSNNIF
jgi:PDDEXK-like domain of unknown function (DUF3799)